MRKTSRRKRQTALAPDATEPVNAISEAGPGSDGHSSESDDRAPVVSDAPATPSADRLSVALTDDGRIEVPSRESTRARLKKALSDPTLGSRLGLDSAPADTSATDPMICGVLYNALSSLLVSVVRRKGFTSEQAQVMAFSQTEVDALTPTTTRVLNKYLGSAGKYQDEILLALSLSSIISGKLALLERSAQVLHMVPPQASQPTTEAPIA